MAVSLALLSGLIHAVWNALTKRSFPDRGGDATLVVITLSLVCGLLALPLVAWPLGELALTGASLPWIALAGLGEAAYVRCLGRAYEAGDLGLTYSISRGTALVVIWPVAWALFGDAPSTFGVIATLLVLGGVVLARPQSTAARPEPTWSMPWTLGTGVAIGLYHAGYEGAVSAGASAIPAFCGALSIAVPILWATHRRAAALAPLFAAPGLVAAGVLSAASFIVLVIALGVGSAGPMLGVRNASVGFALALAYAMGERPSRRQWLGMALLVLGVAGFALP